ncbi:hypothetical protein [Ligilactobacillus ruminis]|uniref:hypothetical protein n=1 Tax=Ligilactobacillus ruminis TaxID=1623 RepID=UPI003F9A76FB
MDDFVLLSKARGLILEPAVEHFFDFLRFCSTFESARPEFGPTGRQKRGIPPGFCLLSLEIQSGLRAKRRFLKSARKIQASATGKTAIFEICP